MRRKREPYRRKDRAGWWCVVYDERGKRVRRCFASDDEGRDAAVVRRAEYERRVELIEAGVVEPRELEVAEGKKRLLVDALELFLASSRIQRKSAGYRRELRWWVEAFIKTSKLKRIGDVRSTDVARFLDDRADAGYAASSYARGRTRLVTFFNFCVAERWLDENPAKGAGEVPEGEDGSEKPAALTVAQLEALLGGVNDAGRRLRYLLGARAGIRWQEIHRLRWRHLDVEAGWFRLDAKVTKMKRAAELPMRAEVAAAARAWREVCGEADGEALLFATMPSRYTWLADLDRAGVIRIEATRVMKLSGKRASKPERRPTTNLRLADEVKLHGYRDDRGRVLSRRCLRLTFGTHLAMVEPNIATVAKLMRHPDPKLTLELYNDARLMDLRGASSKLDALSGSGVSVVSMPGANDAPGCSTLHHAG